MSQAFQSQLLWKIGDPATEVGAAVTNLTFANGTSTQHSFDFSTAPLTDGRMVAGGTLSTLSWATIDTKGCDMLAICAAFKCTAQTNGGANVFGTNGAGAAIVAVGTPMRNDNNYGIWSKHPASRLGGNPGAAAGSGWGAEQLWVYGQANYRAQLSDGQQISLTDDLMMDGMLGYPATALASGQYFRTHAWLGKRTFNQPGVTVATPAAATPEPSIRGYQQAQIAMVLVTDCGASAPTGVTYCGEIYAVRIWNTPGYPNLQGIQTS